MQRKPCPRKLLSLFIFIVFLSSLFSCSRDYQVSDRRLMMGTTVEIKALGKDKKRVKDAVREAFKAIKEIDDLMNYYDKSSTLSQLNNQARHQAVEVDNDIYYVVDKCLKFGKMTEGAFDITATSLDKYSGYEDIALDADKKTIYFKDSKLKIDLSAAAKGYAVDKGIETLKDLGIDDAMVNAGGDIEVMGKFYKRPWSIGIRHPKVKGEILCAISLSDEAIATSGNYLRCHIIDTLENDFKDYKVLSSTVIANDCLTADILATSLFVMGQRGINLVEKLNNVEALLIIEKNAKIKFIESSNFNKYMIKENLKD